MKKLLLITAMALAAGTAFAQAPAGTLSKPPAANDPLGASGKAGANAQMNVDGRTAASPKAPTDPATQGSGNAAPPSQINPAAATGTAGANAQAKVDARTAGMPMTAGDAATKGAAMQAMDANGDGMISRREYDRHHAMMWKQMKPTKNMVPKADYEAAIKGGPN